MGYKKEKKISDGAFGWYTTLEMVAQKIDTTEAFVLDGQVD